MLRTKRQLSQGSVNAVGPPLQRRRSSITQASIGRQGEHEDRSDDTHDRRTQGYSAVHLPAVYNQQFSHAPIINGNIYGGVQNNIQSSTLDSLQFLYQHAAMGAVHESNERFPPPLCFPGTRDVVVGRVIGWYLDKDGQKKIMWVHAPLGYGKTAVAGTVKETLDGMQLGFDSPVGATFFFWRSSAERNSPARFIITLAYQLAQSIPELCPGIEVAIKSKPGIVKMALENQLIELIVKPFKSLPNLNTMPNRLVIVDGIDECINSDRESLLKKEYAEDQEGVQIRVLNLIHHLHSHSLPLSFLLLSRPEAWITRHLEAEPFCDVVEPLDLYEVGDHIKDVKRFVRAELSRIAKHHRLEEPDEEWPEEEALVRRSEGHMVYAATVIRHIDDDYGDPRQLLKDIIENAPAHRPDISHSTPFSYLYELYRQIMRSCPERNRSLMMEVLGEVIVSYDINFEDEAHNAALGVLDRLSRRPSGSGVKALRPLHAVLKVGKGNEDELIRFLFIHSSFEEFLKSPHLSFEFSVDANKAKARLLSTMLDRMTSITTDTVGSELEYGVVFALHNWCYSWARGRRTFLKSITTYLPLLNKIIALDLTACIIQTYCSLNQELCGDYSPLYHLLDTRKPSKFFVESMNLDGCADTLSIAQKVTSHTRSSLESAFTFMLQATTPLALSNHAVDYLAGDCASYLHEVTSQPDWREHKVVRALGTPGPNGIDLYKKIIDVVYDWGNQDDLLKHIYKVMVREKNPILESEDNPFEWDDNIDEPESESDYESDSESLTSSIDSDEE
ncbi:hypothetical protein EST38_g13565 [Candolleomyces aberdarensis]|uniref:Nephrocystin 3-like N-terminal domain-containing protein n=1 Tax=Candolleomyces aberdarensis TaxID=2316362 RepID=A0A4Q2D0F0_9AGAR|nr:hypothetical protein EST38_g13565 [Candolleomyces aberdarensis]